MVFGQRSDPASGLVEEAVRQSVHRAEHFAVDVELALAPGVVADPHRSGMPPAGQVRQRPLGQIPLAADAEHDLQIAAVIERAGRRRGHVVEELIRFVGTGGYPQRLDGERCVADAGAGARTGEGA